MELVIIRHGQAASPGAYSRDSERPLTDVGHADTRRLGQRLLAAGLAPDHVFSSPYVRARETTENIVAAFDGVPVDHTERLVPHADPRELAQWGAKQAAGYGRVYLVGHLPLVGETVALLMGCAPHVPVIVPGTAVHLKLHSSRGPIGLMGMLQPQHTIEA
jgi:phosphohistidine phosphatase